MKNPAEFVRRFGIAICIVSAVAVIVALCLGRRAADADPVTSIELEHRGPLETESTGAMPVAIGNRVPVPDPTARSSYLIDIFDESGDPIVDALAYATQPHASFVQHSEMIVADSSSGGRMTIQGDVFDEAARQGVIMIYAPGYTPKIALEREQYQKLQLSRGFRWGVRCLDVAGNPVSGATIAIASAAGQPDLHRAVHLTVALRAGLAPGPSSERRVFVVESNDEGIAVFEGLQPGLYRVMPHHNTHVPARVEPPEAVHSIAIPGPSPTIVFHECCAVVVRIVGDEILGTTSTRRRQVGLPFATSIHRVASRLKGEFPDDRVFVDVSPLSGSTQSPPTVSISVLFAHSGWEQRTFELVPLSAPDGLQTWAAPPHGDDLTVPVEFRPSEPMHSIEGGPRFMVSGEFENRTFGTWVEVGEVKALPPGEYEVSGVPELVRKCLVIPDRITVTHSDRVVVDIPVKRSMQPCRIRLAGEAGLGIPPMRIRIADADGDGLHWDGWVPEDGDGFPSFTSHSSYQWFPKVMLQYEASGHAVRPTTGWVDLAAADAGQIREIEIRVFPQ